MTTVTRSDIRNIAIIAHVDHGKTTLVDQMLKQSGTLTGRDVEVDRIMDSGDIERERGITILAKNTAIQLDDVKINILDTPGHMDFGGEVERVLQMVEGFMLLVDAAEGPLPGTRFVLKKALQLNLKPLVLINKIDRKDADIERTEEMIHDLFLDLAQDTDQLDFPLLYGSSKHGFASFDPTKREGDMKPLFEAIINHVPAPTQQTADLQVLVTNLDYSDFLGRIAIGRVISGKINSGKQVVACRDGKVSKPLKITKLYQYHGVQRIEADEAKFGDIVAFAGVGDEITIGTTICDVDKPLPVDYVSIDEPTLSLFVSVNTSPFAGKEGKLLTSRQIRDRLYKELMTNVALRVEETDSAETFKVSGRGQLHLAVLIETMRREGFEVQLSAPEVITKVIDGKKHEPIELLSIDIEDQYQGVVMEKLGVRKAQLQNMEPHGDRNVLLEFTVPARGLIGFRSQFVTDTRGTGILNHRFHSYAPYMGDIPGRSKGSLISMEAGATTAYALDSLKARGILFVGPTLQVYEGMIVGEHTRENDLPVNPTKKKKLTNMRASGSDDAVRLSPPREVMLESSLEWIKNDELIEVTPQSIRLRKKFLKATDRKRSGK